MNVWQIRGRHFAAPLPADWRPRLVERLGQRPRRLGEWAEIALYGALACLDGAGERALPGAALLSVSSLQGPDRALQAALAEAREGLPLPIGFLNSQPNQLLPALAQYLAWQGNGRCLSSRDPAAALFLACLEAGADGMLLGWVEEGPPGQSLWLRLVPAPRHGGELRPGTFADLRDESTGFLAWDRGQLRIGPAAPTPPETSHAG